MSLSVTLPLLLSPLLSLACVDPTQVQEDNVEELITTVILEASSGDQVVSARWEDLELSGQPTVEPLELNAGLDYQLQVRFLNALDEPAEEVTDEILAEGIHHQIFFTGAAVQGPANPDNSEALIQVTYADQDTSGNPLGLDNDMIVLGVGVLGVGSSELTLTLRHVPAQGGVEVKTASLAQDLAAGDWSDLPGDNDVQVVFPVEVIAP